MSISKNAYIAVKWQIAPIFYIWRYLSGKLEHFTTIIWQLIVH